MKSKVAISFYSLLMLVVCTHGATRVRVLGDSVNLRAGPSLHKEVVSQVSSADTLTVVGPLEGEWVEVMPTSSTALWVYDEFVSGGTVLVSRLLVRAGPGMNYSVLGRLEKGSKVDALEVKGMWRKIKAPSSCHLWVSREYVELIPQQAKVRKPVLPAAGTPPMPKKGLPRLKTPVPEKRTIKTVPVTIPHKQSTPAEDGVDREKLVADIEQGKKVQYSGTLYKASMPWRRPSKYRLMKKEGRGRMQTVCYVLGEEADLESFARKSVLITGTEYWVQGLRHPVVKPNELILTE